MNILFMGTPDFAKESLKSLCEANYNVIGVVTNPDKPKGRGMKMIASPVKEYAQLKNIPIYQPLKVKKNDEFIQLVKGLNPDIICVVAYGKILPKELLNIPKFGCINVHGSLLPKYRGAAPIQWSIINGDEITGITTMLMDEGMDTGDILLKEEVEIGNDETTGELWKRLSILGGKLLIKTLMKIEEGDIKRIKQDNEYSIAPMLDKKMSNIDWKEKEAYEIKNLVRGLDPIMGTYSYLNGKKYKIWKVQALSENANYRNENVEAGTIINIDSKNGIFVKAKKGVIQILEIQAENAKRMNVCEFLRGNKIESGSKFEKIN